MTFRFRASVVLFVLAAAGGTFAQPAVFGAATGRPSSAESERLRAELVVLREQLSSRETQTTQRARGLYRLRRAGMLPVAGGFTAMLGHLSRMKRLDRMLVSDVAATAFLKQRVEALTTDLSEAERRESELARQAELAAAQQQGSWGEFGAVAAGLPPLRTTSGFESLRGRLPLPVPAHGVVRNARRADGAGFELTVSAGEPVRASASGKVVFASVYAGYGPLVVLDHGAEFYTLYGGFDRVLVRNDEWVAEGASLGLSGSAAVYFEVRQGTRTLSVREWTGL